MIRLIISILIFSLIIAIPPFVLGNYFALSGLLAPKFWKMFLFFLIITYVVCISVTVAQQKSGALGTQMFLGATVIKLLACMSFALIYIRQNPVQPMRFILSFFYLYFLYTAFEIYVLLSNLRVQNKK